MSYEWGLTKPISRSFVKTSTNKLKLTEYSSIFLNELIPSKHQVGGSSPSGVATSKSKIIKQIKILRTETVESLVVNQHGCFLCIFVKKTPCIRQKFDKCDECIAHKGAKGWLNDSQTPRSGNDHGTGNSHRHLGSSGTTF